MTSRTAQIMRTWVSCKAQKTLPARTGARLFRDRKMAAHEGAFMSLLRDSREDREFYQAKTVKTHSKNLELFAEVVSVALYI